MNPTVSPQHRLEGAQHELARVIIELNHQVDRDSPKRLAHAFFDARDALGLSSYDVDECAAFLERVTLEVRKRAIARRIDPPRA